MGYDRMTWQEDDSIGTLAFNRADDGLAGRRSPDPDKFGN
jgi:hypothetical protein